MRIIGEYTLAEGWASQNLVTAACGVSIFVSTNIPTPALHTVFTPPREIQGRAGGIRLQTKALDFVIFCVYLAPMHDGKKKVIAQKVFQWMERELDGLGVRSAV
eukprot:4309326-Pyramimonas_sp.AAC.1